MVHLLVTVVGRVIVVYEAWLVFPSYPTEDTSDTPIGLKWYAQRILTWVQSSKCMFLFVLV